MSLPSLRYGRSLLVALPIAAVLLYLAFRGVDWREMLAAVASARPEFLASAFAAWSAGLLLRALRWRVLLGAEIAVRPVTVFWAVSVGYLGNQFLPARAGELLRSVMLARRTGASASYVLATALTERVLDALALVAIGLGALSLTGVAADWLLGAARLMAVAALLGVGGLLLLPRLEKPLVRLLARLPLADGPRARLLDLLRRFLLGLGAFQHPGRALSFVGLTGVVWLLDGVAAISIAAALGQTLSLPQALLLLSGLGLASALPSTPGYLGIYQFVARSILPLFGFSDALALAYVICLQAVAVVLVLVWGSLGAWRLGGGGPAEP